jgi:Domain of unknown function (DUF4157)
MTAGRVKSIGKTQRCSEPSSPTYAFVRQSGVGPPRDTFDTALVPQIAGNLAVQQFFQSGAIQAKLDISRAGDADEEEADRVADQVMRMAEPAPIGSAPSTTQRKCAVCEAGGATCPKCQEGERLRRKEKPGHAPQATPAIHSQIAALWGGGQPLPPSVRAFFEPRFGRDFSQVRVHTDARAAHSAQALRARAFTVGREVVFGSGHHSRDTGEGRRLWAHELAHTLQQSGSQGTQSEVLTEPPQSTPTVHGGGPSVWLHGDTTAEYDGGTSKWAPKSMKRAKSCTDCPADDSCLHAVGTFSVTYHANVTIKMPDMPGGLTECQERRVRAFLRDVLGPHEREHARRFHTYDGTTTHRIDFTGCGSTALQEHLQEIHDNEEAKRHSDAESISAAIDPFNRPIDLDCNN